MVRCAACMIAFVSGFTALAVVGHKRLKVNFTTTFTVDVVAAVIAAFGSSQAFFADTKLFGNQLFTDLVAEGDALVLPKLAYLHEKLMVLEPDL